jgi:hypothetical protein
MLLRPRVFHGAEQIIVERSRMPPPALRPCKWGQAREGRVVADPTSGDVGSGVGETIIHRGHREHRGGIGNE